MRKVTEKKRQLHIGNKLLAMVLSVAFLALQIAACSESVSADSTDHVYPDAHGKANDSTDLYLWHLADGGSGKKLQDYLQFADKSQPFRVLLTYYDKSNFGKYYYEANWTKIKYGTPTSDICAAYSPMTDINDNPQVRLGEKEFVTRGGLRALYASYKGPYKDFRPTRIVWSSSSDEFKGTHAYEFYAPNEKDDGIEVINGNKLTFWFTRGKDYIDWWFYDGAGKPHGSPDLASFWAEKSNQKKYYDDLAKGNFNRIILIDGGERTVYDTGFNEHEVPTMELVCQETWAGADPQIVHSSSTLHYGDVNIKPQSLTVDETFQTDMNDELKWVVYVGEKIGDNVQFIGGTGTNHLEVSKVLDVPSFIKREQTLVIDEGVVLYVKSALMLEGAIENHGLIVVCEGGSIAGNLVIQDPRATSRVGYINCDGGDIMIKPGGGVSVDDLALQKGSTLELGLGSLLTVKERMVMGDCSIEIADLKYRLAYQNKSNQDIMWELLQYKWDSNYVASRYYPQICIYPTKYNEYKSVVGKKQSSFFRGVTYRENHNGKTEIYSKN